MAGPSTKALNLFNKLQQKGPKAVRPTAGAKTIGNEIKLQKELGPFLPEKAAAKLNKGERAKLHDPNRVKPKKFGPRVGKSEKAMLQKEIAKQKELGPFLPEKVSANLNIRNGASKLNSNNYMNIEDSVISANGVYMGKPRGNVNPKTPPTAGPRPAPNPDEKIGRKYNSRVKQEPKSTASTDSTNTTSTGTAQDSKSKEKTTNEKAEDQTKKIHAILDKMDEADLDGGPRGIGVTAKTLFTDSKDFYHDPVKGEARRKNAYMGTFQAATVSAVGHAGLAALEGDDVWESAKTGFVRGAAVGGGYQALKGATRANEGSIWGNIKHINATTKDIYKTTTVKGREQIRKEGTARSLNTLLNMESSVVTNKSLNGRKGNTTTAQVMNQ